MIFQAGDSSQGRQLGAAISEGIYTNADNFDPAELGRERIDDAGYERRLGTNDRQIDGGRNEQQIQSAGQKAAAISWPVMLMNFTAPDNSRAGPVPGIRYCPPIVSRSAISASWTQFRCREAVSKGV